jgi:DNA-binding CsgD family transcriptional regulator
VAGGGNASPFSQIMPCAGSGPARLVVTHRGRDWRLPGRCVTPSALATNVHRPGYAALGSGGPSVAGVRCGGGRVRGAGRPARRDGGRGHHASAHATAAPCPSAGARSRAPWISGAAAEAGLVSEPAGLLGEVTRSAPASVGPPCPGEPLTQRETRVLRYLPTHMGASEIAAELFVSANTVRTHLRHLYRKLGAHSRREAVQRAQAIGLLAGSSRRP